MGAIAESLETPGAPAAPAPAAAPATPAAPADWRAELPDELKTSESLKDIKDVSGLAKGYVNAQSMLGTAIRIPSEHASDEDRAAFLDKLKAVPGVVNVPQNPDDKAGWDAYYNQMGRPPEAKEYGDYKPENWPDGWDYDADQEGAFKEIFHALGLTKAQADGLMGAYNTRTMEALGALDNGKNEASEALKKEWGANYDRNMNIGSQVIRQFLAEDEGRDSVLAELDRTGLGNMPAMAKFLRNVGTQMLEDDALQAAGQNTGSGLTAHELRSRINEVVANQKHAYYDNDNPGHKDAIDMVQGWYAQLEAMQSAGVS